MHKDLRKMVKALEAQGFETQTTKQGHVQVRKDGLVVTVFGGTPSDHRSWLNSLARARRAGFIWPPQP
jgi:predicted RNA binding protein YcfA (HicA-like mRNA interferase family)